MRILSQNSVPVTGFIPFLHSLAAGSKVQYLVSAACQSWITVSQEFNSIKGGDCLSISTVTSHYVNYLQAIVMMVKATTPEPDCLV